MKIIILILALATSATAGTYTTNLNLYKTAVGDTNYVTPFATGMDTIDSYLWGIYTSTGNFVEKTGATMTGQLTTASSMTATLGFVGDLTGSVTGSSSLNVLKAGDTMTGPLTLSGSSLTVTGSAFSVGTSTLVVSGGKVGIGTNAPTDFLTIGRGDADIGIPTLMLRGGVSSTNRAASIKMFGTTADYGFSFNYDGNSALGLSINNHVNSAVGTTAMFIARATGLVGIGTTAPANALHVKGTTGIAVSSATTAGLSMVFRGAESKANILAVDPVAAGEFFYCTDCTAEAMCVSTGTAVGAWTKFTDKTAVCD